MRRALMFLLYSVMTAAGTFGIVRFILYSSGGRAIGVMACGFLMLFGLYLLWIDFIAPAFNKEEK